MYSSSYSLDACVVVQRRGDPEAFEGPFTLGLLTRAPTPEGTHATELQAPGYLRPSIEFGPPGGDRLGGARRNGGRVSLGAIGDYAGEAKYAAVFRDNEIVAYGPAVPAPGHVGPQEIAFESSAVRLKF